MVKKNLLDLQRMKGGGVTLAMRGGGGAPNPSAELLQHGSQQYQGLVTLLDLRVVQRVVQLGVLKHGPRGVILEGRD